MIFNGLSGTIASEIGSLNSNSNNIYLETLCAKLFLWDEYSLTDCLCSSLSANPVSGTLPSEVESLSSMRGLYVSLPLVRWRVKILMFGRVQPCGGFGDVNQWNDTNLVGFAHFDGITVRCT